MIYVIRHRRENLKKCSLRGIEHREGFSFSTYPTDPFPQVSSCLLLKVGAPVLSEKDRGKNLLLIDGTWRLASLIEKQLPCEIEGRSLPDGWKSAYPRRQTDCPLPEAGLASIEALYVACLILDLPREGLLDHYYWRDLFFQKNAEIY